MARGETEHIDFAVQIQSENNGVRPAVLVELKRVSIDLRSKHLKQVASYAINTGCEWILLTIGRQWRLHHVAFGKPPVAKLLHEWNLLEDDLDKLEQRFRLITYRHIKRGRLEKLWEKRRVLDARNLIRTIFSEPSVKVLRREIRRNTGVMLGLEDVIAGVRRLLNENAIAEMGESHHDDANHSAACARLGLGCFAASAACRP